MKSLSDCRLYTFVDTAYLAGRNPLEIARELCAAGSDLIQFRAKDWPRDKTHATAASLADICARAGVWFVVNDHPAIAREVGAPLCHLGQEDFFDSGWRRVADLKNSLPPARTKTSSMEIGLSSHSQEQALRAVDAGAAYIAIGPVFATPTKPGRPAVSTDLVRWAASRVEIPWFAIGGINESSLQEVLEAGARRVAIVSGILGAENIQETCRRYRELIESVG